MMLLELGISIVLAAVILLVAWLAAWGYERFTGGRS